MERILKSHPGVKALVLAGVFLPLLLAAGVELAAALQEEQAEKPNAAVPLQIPDAEKERANPYTSDEEVTALGQKLFSSQCRMCHGPEGRGDGDLAEEMKLVMPDLTSEATQKRTDGEIFYVISQGHGHMPAQGKRMPEKNRWAFVNHIRELAKQKPAAAKTE